MLTNDDSGDSDVTMLVRVSGVRGARTNGGSSMIGRWDYGATNSLAAYRENQINFDTSTIDNDVELKNIGTIPIPRDGAAVSASFEADEGRSAILNTMRSNHQTISLGAEVYGNSTQISNMG